MHGHKHEHVYKKRRLVKTLPDGRAVYAMNCWRCGFGVVTVERRAVEGLKAKNHIGQGAKGRTK
jgi:hypothetical protein